MQLQPVQTSEYGKLFQGLAEDVLLNSHLKNYKGKAQLIFTSPPFPLGRKKKYGNLNGIEYITWLSKFAPIFRDYLTDNGSIVLEIGNAWEKGKPIMSTLPMEALLMFKKSADLHLCQEFIVHNPARLPSPAQWVNIERIRVKDSFTRIWWLSKIEKPKANNKNILTEYSNAMQNLIKTQRYNAGKRPSEHSIGRTSFLKDNKGAIPPNVLIAANTSSNDPYLKYCRENSLPPHPARMAPKVVEFFIKFLTDPNDLVLDPFSGSNTTGVVAERLKRKWVSIELQEEYIKSAKARLILETYGSAVQLGR